MTDVSTPRPRPPKPWSIFLLAALLPGWGHWRLGMVQRGVTFVFFIGILGWITWKIAPVERSLVGRTAGGLFVYALSVMDAYRIARIRWEEWKHRSGQVTPPEGRG